MSKSRRDSYVPLGGLSTRTAWAIIAVVAVYIGIGLGALLGLTIGPTS